MSKREPDSEPEHSFKKTKTDNSDEETLSDIENDNDILSTAIYGSDNSEDTIEEPHDDDVDNDVDADADADADVDADVDADDDDDDDVDADDEITNRCISCNYDLGANNGRQYCCKTYCPEEVI
jgi:hypothetical protein